MPWVLHYARRDAPHVFPCGNGGHGTWLLKSVTCVDCLRALARAHPERDDIRDVLMELFQRTPNF